MIMVSISLLLHDTTINTVCIYGISIPVMTCVHNQYLITERPCVKTLRYTTQTYSTSNYIYIYIGGRPRTNSQALAARKQKHWIPPPSENFATQKFLQYLSETNRNNNFSPACIIHKKLWINSDYLQWTTDRDHVLISGD